LTSRELTEQELKSLETAFVWNTESLKFAISKCRTVKEFRENMPAGMAMHYSMAFGRAQQASQACYGTWRHERICDCSSFGMQELETIQAKASGRMGSCSAQMAWPVGGLQPDANA
jgi:hypothetical protein